MTIAVSLIQQIAIMFIMIAFGFFAAKCKVITVEGSRGLSVMALYVIIPCVLVNAFQVPFTRETFQGLMLAFAASLGVNLFYIFVTKILNRIYPMSVVERASLIYPNAGNLIVPMVGAILGEDMILYCSAFMIVQNLFVWTHGKLLISGEDKPTVKNVICNSTVLSILLGIFLAVTKIQLPGLLESAVSSVGKALAPVCMFVTGVTVGSIPLKKALTQKRVYLICLLRLVVYPFLVILLIRFSNMHHYMDLAPQILLIVFLAAAAPAASNIVQFAQYYRKDEYTAGLINVVSTLLCIITMPALLFIFQLLIPV